MINRPISWAAVCRSVVPSCQWVKLSLKWTSPPCSSSGGKAWAISNSRNGVESPCSPLQNLISISTCLFSNNLQIVIVISQMTRFLTWLSLLLINSRSACSAHNWNAFAISASTKFLLNFSVYSLILYVTFFLFHFIVFRSSSKMAVDELRFRIRRPLASAVHSPL